MTPNLDALFAEVYAKADDKLDEVLARLLQRSDKLCDKLLHYIKCRIKLHHLRKEHRSVVSLRSYSDTRRAEEAALNARQMYYSCDCDKCHDNTRKAARKHISHDRAMR